MKEIRVGLVGYGFMGKSHSNAYLKVAKFFPMQVKPVMKVVCEMDESRAKFAQENWGWEKYETDVHKLINSGEIDLLDITTPNNSHGPIAIAAAQKGLAVACEKPLAMNSDEARKMVSAVKKANVPNMVWFNYRRCPAIGLAKQIINEGRIGRIYHVRAVYLQEWIMDPNFPLVWRLNKNTAGSGAHGDLNAHIIDLARYLAGDFDEVVGIQETFIKERPLVAESGALAAKGGKKKGTVTVDDATLFLAKFKDGAIGTFEATRFAGGRKNHNRIEINGSKGSLVFNFERMNELEYFTMSDPPHLQGFRTILATDAKHPYMFAWWPAGHLIGYEHTFINQAYDLITGIAKRKKLEPNFEDALKVQQVLDAVSLSAKEGKWIKVDKM